MFLQECHAQKNKKFNLRMLSTFESDSGGTDVFQVVPKEGVTHIRLHHITNFLHFPDLHNTRAHHVDKRPTNKGKFFQSVSNWQDIWSCCSGWVKIPPKLQSGKLTRGIVSYDGNSIRAAAEYKGRLYAVHGVW
jgi:hypothetical protein